MGWQLPLSNAERARTLTRKEGSTALTQGNPINQSVHVDNHTAGTLTSNHKTVVASSASVAYLCITTV